MEKRKLEINEENVRLDKFLIYQEHLFKNILKKGMFL